MKTTKPEENSISYEIKDKVDRIFRDDKNEYMPLASSVLLNRAINHYKIVSDFELELTLGFNRGNFPKELSKDYNPYLHYHLLSTQGDSYHFVQSLTCEDFRILLSSNGEEVLNSLRGVDIDLLLPKQYKFTAVKLFYKRRRKKVSVTIDNNLYELEPITYYPGEFKFYMNKKKLHILADNANELITPLYKHITTL